MYFLKCVCLCLCLCVCSCHPKKKLFKSWVVTLKQLSWRQAASLAHEEDSFVVITSLFSAAQGFLCLCVCVCVRLWVRNFVFQPQSGGTKWIFYSCVLRDKFSSTSDNKVNAGGCSSKIAASALTAHVIVAASVSTTYRWVEGLGAVQCDRCWGGMSKKNWQPEMES